MTPNDNHDLARARPWELIVVIAATAAKLWLVEARRLVALAWAQHDDVWFLDKARSIMEGQWLGSYDSLTLIKGPGYPLWVALVSSLHLPLLLSQQFLYAVACFAACQALAPVLRSPAARVALFGLLLFNPLTYTDDTSTRVTREGFYPALALLVFAGVAGTLLRVDTRRRAVGWALLSGVSLAALWHTREESVWILPMLLIAATGAGAWVSKNWRERRVFGMLVVAIPSGIALSARVAIVLINGWKYDSFVVSEFADPDFLRAYGSLTHIRQHPSRPRIPVPAEVRARVYARSPAFAELRPYLEGELGQRWVEASGVQGNGEIGGAWFQWAFREAVDKVGYYKRGAAAVREYHARLSGEIEKARVEGRLDARKPRSSLMPPLLHGQRREILRTWKEGMLIVLTFAHFDLNSLYSQGTDAELEEFERATRSRMAPRETVERVRLLGWALHVEGALELAVEDAQGRATPDAKVLRLASPDVYDHLKSTWKPFPPARHAAFDITAPLEGATLVLSRQGRELDRIPLRPPYTAVTSNMDVRMVVNERRIESERSEIPPRDRVRLRMLVAIARVYQKCFAPLFALALLAWIAGTPRLIRRGSAGKAATLIFALLAAVAARILILAAIHVVAFWSFTGAYEAPAHPLLIVAGFLLASEAVSAFRPRLPVG